MIRFQFALCSVLLIPLLGVCTVVPSVTELQRLIPKLSTDYAVELHNKAHIYRYYYKGEHPLFDPSTDIAQAEQSISLKNAFKPTINVEALYYVPVAGLSPNNASHLLTIYNTLQSISSLTGVEYYSESRARMRTLFKSAYVVDNEPNQLRTPDPVAKSIPAHESLTIFQEDLTFGKNLCQAKYSFSEGSFQLSITNLTDMRYAFFPFIRKGNMRTQLILKPLEGGILIYGNIGVKTMRFMGLEKKKQASFYNRLNTLFNWFTNEIGSKIQPRTVSQTIPNT